MASSFSPPANFSQENRVHHQSQVYDALTKRFIYKQKNENVIRLAKERKRESAEREKNPRLGRYTEKYYALKFLALVSLALSAELENRSRARDCQRSPDDPAGRRNFFPHFIRALHLLYSHYIERKANTLGEGRKYERPAGREKIALTTNPCRAPYPPPPVSWPPPLLPGKTRTHTPATAHAASTVDRGKCRREQSPLISRPGSRARLFRD